MEAVAIQMRFLNKIFRYYQDNRLANIIRSLGLISFVVAFVLFRSMQQGGEYGEYGEYGYAFVIGGVILLYLAKRIYEHGFIKKMEQNTKHR